MPGVPTHEHDGCEQVIAMLRDDLDKLTTERDELREELELMSTPLGFLYRAMGMKSCREVTDIVAGLP